MNNNLKTIFRFLNLLAEHNNRDWFNENKDLYLEAKSCFDTLVASLLSKLVVFEPTLGNIDPKQLSFRIYRDVRFSKDKRPYKTNMGATFSPNRKMEQEPGYYLHIEPHNKSFLAGGFYMPDKTNLAKIRQEIDYHPERIQAILKNKSFATWYTGLDDWGRLKKNPKGFAADHPMIDLLKNKSFVASHTFSDEEVTNANFIDQLVSACKAVKPLNDFTREAIL